jgi:hypothetical protein
VLKPKSAGSGFLMQGVQGAVEIPTENGSSLSVVVVCQSSFDCRLFGVDPDTRKKVVSAPATKDTARFAIPGGPGHEALAVTFQYNNKPASNVIKFESPATGATGATGAAGGAGGAGTGAAAGGGGGGGGSSPSVADLLAVPCRNAPSGSSATFFVTPSGRFLSPPPNVINEGDDITVDVFMPTELATRVVAKRTSAARPEHVTNNYGQTESPFKETSKGIAPIPCQVVTFPLGQFAPGKGEIEIVAIGDATPQSLSGFNFNVNNLYTGTFALGGVWTTVASPEFHKIYTGKDTIISATNGGGRALLVATYTRFRKERDLTQEASGWRRVSPVFGVGLSDAKTNLLYGVSIELVRGVYAIGGWHTAKVDELDPASGASINGAFDNVGSVPTTSYWTTKPFYGVQLDVFTAAALLRSIIGKATQGS